MTVIRTLRPGALLCLAANLAIAGPPADIEGTWISGDGDGWIELYIDGDELRGRIVGSPDDPDHRKPPRFDVENPDPDLRGRPLLGLVILTGFRYAGDGEWKGGRIYDPNSGNTYKGAIRMQDAGTLDLRGYVGISLFGRTETWNRRPDHE